MEDEYTAAAVSKTLSRPRLVSAEREWIHQLLRYHRNLEHPQGRLKFPLRRVPPRWLSQNHLIEIEIEIWIVAIVSEHSSRTVTVQIHYNCLCSAAIFRGLLHCLAVVLAINKIAKLPVSRLVYEHIFRSAS